MKKKIFIWICFFCCLLLFIMGCDNRTESEKLARRAMHKTAVILEKRHQMKFIGWSEGGDEHYYNNVGLNFKVFRVLSKEEGRIMLIDGVEELVKEFNATPELQPFLNPAPFMPSNVKMHIYDYQPDGGKLYYPNIVVFSAYDGKVQYSTKIPEKEFGYYTQDEETYEEALNIVRSQKSP